MKLEKKWILPIVAVLLILVVIMAAVIGTADPTEKKANTEASQETDSVTDSEQTDEKENTEEEGEKSTAGETQTASSDKKENTKPVKGEKSESSQTGSSSGNGHTSLKRPEIHFAPSKGESSGKGENSADSPYAQIAEGKITCDSFGRYTGQYVEDGRDELVENVATVLVTNRSDEYLEYASLTFDVDGNAANFIVTGLPANTSAWVMDASRLTIQSGASFTYQECTSSFRDDIDSSSDKVQLKADGNMLTATNQTGESLEEVVVYYRVMHTDGNYLGGVTYTVNYGTLKPGESSEKLAGHYSADQSEVVRVSWNNS